MKGISMLRRSELRCLLESLVVTLMGAPGRMSESVEVVGAVRG